MSRGTDGLVLQLQLRRRVRGDQDAAQGESERLHRFGSGGRTGGRVGSLDPEIPDRRGIRLGDTGLGFTALGGGGTSRTIGARGAPIDCSCICNWAQAAGVVSIQAAIASQITGCRFIGHLPTASGRLETFRVGRLPSTSPRRGLDPFVTRRH